MLKIATCLPEVDSICVHMLETAFFSETAQGYVKGRGCERVGNGIPFHVLPLDRVAERYTPEESSRNPVVAEVDPLRE